MNLSNLKKVFSVCDFENKKIIYFLGFKISHKSKINDVSCRLQKIENKFKKFDLSNKYFPDFTISSLEVHIAEHCNLNCQCCNHYSPLAKEEFLDINIFEKDLNRLSQLTNGNISYLKLLGGEPLLCPNLIDYFQTARKYFPNSNIVLMTNAILLNKCDDNFYEALRKYDIEICLTKYPLKIDFKAIEKKFKNTIINLCSQELASYMVPKDVIILSEIPLTSAMKTNFKELENIYKEKYSSKPKQKVKKR